MQKGMRLGLVLALAMTGISCADDPPLAPSPVNVYVNQNQVVYAPTPTQPGTGPGQGTVTAVAIGKYGEDSCANPYGSADGVRVGCVARLTCTPKCGSRDCTPEEHGAAPTFFGAISNAGKVSVAPDPRNPFILEARGVASGAPAPRFLCTVLGVSSREAELTVVP